MSYTKHNFQRGERLLASQLNEMEDQIAQNAEDIAERASFIYDTASGDIVNFSDGADEKPLKSLVATIEPVQDLHGYDYPWPGGGGVNKFDESVFANCRGSLQANGVWHFNTLIDILNTVFWTAPESIGQITVTMWRKQISVGSQGIRLVINYTDGTSVKVGNQNATGGTDVYSVTTDASKTVRNIVGDYGTNQNSTDVNVVVSIGSTAPSAYSPYSNICQITGWTGANVTRTGVNVWDEEYRSDGYYDAGGIWHGGNVLSSKNYIPVTPGESYYIFVGAAASLAITFWDENKGFLERRSSQQNIVVVIPDNCHYIMFNMNTVYGTTYNNDISINSPATDTAYHPYTGKQISVTFPSEAGTVYGGTLTLKPDRTGTLVVDRAMVDLGTLTWTKTNPGQFYNETNFGTTNSTNILCSAFRYGQAYSASEDNVIELRIGTYHRTWVRSTLYRNMIGSEFKTAMSGVQLVYPLASPQLYQFTAEQISEILTTLYGTNNIWTDTGSVSITYPADTKLYIDRKISEAVAALNS